MTEVYLFDWGNTLMVDFPGISGKMRYWDKVEAVEGAKEALKALSGKAKIYIATSAADSEEKDIEAAFHRVGLDRFIEGYFCKANVGVEKGHPEFLKSILKKLDMPADRVTVVGDSLQFDIEPALALGIHAVRYDREAASGREETVGQKPGFRIISSLNELHK